MKSQEPTPTSRTLLDALAGLQPKSTRTTLRRMLEAGRVRVDGKIERLAKREVARGAKITIADVGDRPHATKRDLHNARRGGKAPPPFKIIYEDKDLIVIEKPAGLLTSTVPSEKRPTAFALVRELVAEREPTAWVGLVHRLDRDASGLLVFSKNRPAHASLKQQFFDHSAERIYAAAVTGKVSPKAGTLRASLIETPEGSMRISKDSDRGVSAITHYEVAKYISSAGVTLLRVKLETGRKHQIRAMLADRGWAVINDEMYGTNPDGGRLMLAAVELRLRHPQTDVPLVFTNPMPPEMAKLCGAASL